MKRLAIIITIVIITIQNVSAQDTDYSQQVSALKEAFTSKNFNTLKPIIGDNLQFKPFPKEKTTMILQTVLNRFPALDSLKVVEQKKGFSLLRYYFNGSRGTNSGVHFNELGKISRIELIEQVIEREMAASKSVQQPNPGEMGKKFPFKEVIISTQDELDVYGNLYEVDPNGPVILLCHQGRLNKFEYADIAPRLNQMGYNCLAIDQRSGGTFARQENKTHQKATEKGMNTDFLEAKKDIEAAIDFLNKKYNKKIILWGSSYSSVLALHLASNNGIRSIISFSPSNFFKDDIGELSTLISKIDKPYFITSSKKESKDLSEIMRTVNRGEKQMHFTPNTDGFHGSMSLWNGQQGAQEYWAALNNFLSSIK
ncbi:MAG: hypothetical protein Wins2KO_22620 [Winogradskyella sp.]